MKFAYFDPTDGRILQWMDTELFNYNLPDASMLHECDDVEWELQHQGEMMVNAGAIVPYIAPAPDLAQLKAAKWKLIKAERDRLIDQGGYKVGTKWFHSDQKSRSQQLGLVLLGSNIPAGLQWKTMDDSFITMTPELAQQVVAAASASDQAIFSAAETHKAAMEASADPASYDYSSGWPKIYGEDGLK